MTTLKERWVVWFIDGDGSDDWQLIYNSHKKYFPTESEARDFAQKYAFPKKMFYWQPLVSREVSYEITTTHWRQE